MKKELKYAFEFGCPFSYIAWKRILKKWQEKKFDIVFYLSGNTKKRVFSDKIWNRLIESSKKKGIHILKPAKDISLDLLSEYFLRVVPGKRVSYVSNVFTTIFEHDRDLSDTEKTEAYLSELTKDEASSFLVDSSAEISEDLNEYSVEITDTLQWARIFPAMKYEDDGICGNIDFYLVDNLLEKI
ncbi:MAG: hypothetical protein HQM10_06730 [Candidatus Riflebacteria bacterium]|nr:hypothetical protein [Candidatus Riflebacteria bacterium]